MKKRTSRILLAALAVLLMMTMAIPAVAATEPDWEQVEEDFVSSSFSDVKLEIGEKEKPTATVLLNMEGSAVYCSDDSIVSVSKTGVVTGKNEGVAYVVYVGGTGSQEIYRFTVVAEGEKSSGSGSRFDDIYNEAEERIAKGFALQKIMGVVFGVFFSAVVLFVIITIVGRAKSGKLFRAVRANVCDETVEALYESLKKKRILDFRLARDTFNHFINPSEKVQNHLKYNLRIRLAELGTYGLHEARLMIPKEEVEQILREFGAKGEENVWHNLQSLLDLGNYDIYRNVRLHGTLNSSEIDAIVVAERGGVFLLEIKTISGKRQEDGSRLVSYGDLREDPGNQIMRHHFAFEKMVAKDGIEPQQIRDLLVLSYPHGEQRRLVDYASFPQSSYAMVEVDRLLPFIAGQNGPAMSLQNRKAIAMRLTGCSSKFVTSCLNQQELEAAYKNLKENLRKYEPPVTAPAPAPAPAPAADPAAKLCPGCGTKLMAEERFCHSCGQKQP